MKHLVKSVIAAIIAATVPLTTYAAPVIEFGTGSGGAGGTVAFEPRPAPPGVSAGSYMVGSGIFINTIVVSGAPANNGMFDVDGAGVCGDPVGSCGLLSFDEEQQTLVLVGSIPELGLLAPVALVTSSTFTGGGTAQDVDGLRLTGSQMDTKDAELLAALGLDPATTFRYRLFVTGVNSWAPFTGVPPDAVYNVISTELTNTPASITPIPEPGSLLLVGTGLIGVVRAFRRNPASAA